MSKKGISPLIATVLIIGFTVALAAVVMVWISGFIKSTTSSTEEKVTEQVTLLGDLEMKIRNATIDPNDNTAKIEVENKNVRGIEGFIVKLYGSKGTFTNDSVDVALDVFEIKDTIVSYDSSIGTITKVEVIPIVIINGKKIAAVLQSNKFTAITFITSTGGDFLIQNGLGDTIARFSNTGNLVLKGSCSATSCSYPSDGSFVLQDSAGNTVAYIDSSGNMCIEDSDCSGNDANCNNPTDGSFIVKDIANTNVAYINNTGGICLKGTLVQNGSP